MDTILVSYDTATGEWSQGAPDPKWFPMMRHAKREWNRRKLSAKRYSRGYRRAQPATPSPYSHWIRYALGD